MWVIPAAEVERCAAHRGRRHARTVTPDGGPEDVQSLIAGLAALRARIAARNPAVMEVDPADLLHEAREERVAEITGLAE